MEGHEGDRALQIDIDLIKRQIVEISVYLGTGQEGQAVAADYVRGIAFRLDDKSEHLAGSKDPGDRGGQQREIRFKVPEDHYTSSFNVISAFHDKGRGWLYNDLIRTVYFGFKLKEEVFE